MNTSFVCVILLICLCGCSPENSSVEQAKIKTYQQNALTEVVSGIQYVKDPRTGLCFAYYWGGMAQGGPALASVPCESVPTNLLYTAKFNDN